MSEDGKQTIESFAATIAAELGIDPDRVQVVRGPEASKILKLGALAFASATIQYLEEISGTDPDLGEAMLRAMWRQVEEKIHGKDCPPYIFIVLHEYFEHSANWKRMRGCIAATAGSVGDADDFARLVGKAMISVRDQVKRASGDRPPT